MKSLKERQLMCPQQHSGADAPGALPREAVRAGKGCGASSGWQRGRRGKPPDTLPGPERKRGGGAGGGRPGFRTQPRTHGSAENQRRCRDSPRGDHRLRPAPRGCALPDLTAACEDGIWTVNLWPVSDTGVPTLAEIDTACADGVPEIQTSSVRG